MSAVKKCARCGRRINPNAYRVYSSHTRSYYCADIAACARAAKRRKKAVA